MITVHRQLNNTPFLLGTVFNQYRLEELLGQGSSGIVYRAKDLRLLRQVALKILRPDVQENQAAWGTLLREARAISRLNHAYCCTIYEVAEDHELFYIAMEYVAGHRLKDLIPSGGLAKEQMLAYGAQITAALAHAHEHGVIHGDVKSSNVLINLSGDIKMIDFGLALRRRQQQIEKADASSLSYHDVGRTGGTLAYSAPEILRGEQANVQSDIWALGTLLYEMATGKFPFTGRTCFEISMAIMVEDPQPFSRQTDPRLWGIVHRCLQKDCAHRYAAAQEVHNDLERILHAPSPTPVKRFAHFWSAAGHS
jgi:serine/threonine-protein kinase